MKSKVFGKGTGRKLEKTIGLKTVSLSLRPTIEDSYDRAFDTCLGMTRGMTQAGEESHRYGSCEESSM
jgi:hypothetical protein